MNTSTSHATGRKLAKLGAWMQLAILIGLAGTVIGMMQAFKALGTGGVGDPSELSAPIGHVLLSSFAGLAVAFIGIVLMCIAVLATQYRAKWFFWFLIVGGIFWGPVGLFPIAFALIRRHEFFPASLNRQQRAAL